MPFADYRKPHQGYYLKSKQYEIRFAMPLEHNVPFRMDSMHSCSKIVLFYIDTKQGGTNTYGRCVKQNEQPQEAKCDTVCELTAKYQEDISDQLLAQFCVIYNHSGLPRKYRNFRPSEAVFKAEKVFLWMRECVCDVLFAFLCSWEKLRKKFATQSISHVAIREGAVNIDGMTRNLHGRHYHDFTMHYLYVQRPKGMHNNPILELRQAHFLSRRPSNW